MFFIMKRPCKGGSCAIRKQEQAEMPEARSNQKVWWCFTGNSEHKRNTDIARKMKEQLVRLLLQLAGVLWPRG